MTIYGITEKELSEEERKKLCPFPATKKPQHVKRIIAARQRLIHKDPNWPQKRLQKLDEEHGLRQTALEQEAKEALESEIDELAADFFLINKYVLESALNRPKTFQVQLPTHGLNSPGGNSISTTGTGDTSVFSHRSSQTSAFGFGQYVYQSQ